MSSTSAFDDQSTDALQVNLMRIQLGMEVEDSNGETIGKVADVRNGDPEAAEVEQTREPGQEFIEAFGAIPEPNVPPALVPRLLREGYIKIDDKRHFRRDHHYYALAANIAEVDATRVKLNSAGDELIVAGEGA
jgi:hypothetical protein